MASPDTLARYPSLRGRNVFITGGGSGIGAELVRAFAGQGARIAFIDIAVEASQALCRSIAEAGQPAPLFRSCDIRDIAALRETMRQLAADIGDFDVLVNNAANDERHSLEAVTPEYWDDRIAINQRPLFFTCQAVVPGMKRKRGGAIVNVGSISWHIKGAGFPVYATAKSAVSGLTRALARELGPFGIRVNTVTPGWVMTERQVALWLDEDGEDEIRRNQCLLGPLLPSHIARMVLFLASEDSAMCTAQEYIVDAGWT